MQMRRRTDNERKEEEETTINNVEMNSLGRAESRGARRNRRKRDGMMRIEDGKEGMVVIMDRKANHSLS